MKKNLKGKIKEILCDEERYNLIEEDFNKWLKIKTNQLLFLISKSVLKCLPQESIKKDCNCLKDEWKMEARNQVIKDIKKKLKKVLGG